MANSIVVGQKLTGLDIIKPYPRSSQATANLQWNPISNLAISKCKLNHEASFWSNKSRLLINCTKAKRNSLIAYAGNGPEVPMPSTPPPPPKSIQGWFLGVLMSVILPFFGNKLGPLGELKERLFKTVQTVENIAEAVEKVAEEVDKIAEDIADDLPEGKLKDLVDLIEDVAEKTSKTADSLDDIIDKVQEADEHLDDIVESIIKGDKDKDEDRENEEKGSNKPKD